MYINGEIPEVGAGPILVGELPLSTPRMDG